MAGKMKKVLAGAGIMLGLSGALVGCTADIDLTQEEFDTLVDKAESYLDKEIANDSASLEQDKVDSLVEKMENYLDKENAEDSVTLNQEQIDQIVEALTKDAELPTGEKAMELLMECLATGIGQDNRIKYCLEYKYEDEDVFGNVVEESRKSYYLSNGEDEILVYTFNEEGTLINAEEYRLLEGDILEKTTYETVDNEKVKTVSTVDEIPSEINQLREMYIGFSGMMLSGDNNVSGVSVESIENGEITFNSLAEGCVNKIVFKDGRLVEYCYTDITFNGERKIETHKFTDFDTMPTFDKTEYTQAQ